MKPTRIKVTNKDHRLYGNEYYVVTETKTYYLVEFKMGGRTKLSKKNCEVIREIESKQ